MPLAAPIFLIINNIMKSFEYTVINSEGIHTRPSFLLIKKAKNFSSTITIMKDEKKVNLKNFIRLIGMKIKQGDTISINIEGADEDIAALEIEEFLKKNKY